MTIDISPAKPTLSFQDTIADIAEVKDSAADFLEIPLHNYLQSIGQINKSYELINKYDLSNDSNINFYTTVKLNYLLSTFQLNEACNFKDELNSNVKLDFFFLEKVDIFCLILNNVFQLHTHL